MNIIRTNLIRVRNRLAPIYYTNFRQYAQQTNNGRNKNNIPRNIIPKRNVPKIRMPKTPDLIYVPHVLRWLGTKLRFKYLRTLWDSDFSEGAFIYGSTQAICRITEIINENRAEELNGLMTVSARRRLSHEMRYRLTELQKKIVRLEPGDIKIYIPLKVNLINDGRRKNCTVVMRVLALKWFEHTKNVYGLALVVLQTEFTRDYSEFVEPEWIISRFDILECTILSESHLSRLK